MRWSSQRARVDAATTCCPSKNSSWPAFSPEDETYIALYGLWKDPHRELAVTGWVLSGIDELAPLSSGIQLADENLARRSAAFMAATHRARLEVIRSERDPARRFHTYGDVPVGD